MLYKIAPVLLDVVFCHLVLKTKHFSLKAPYYSLGNILHVHYLGVHFQASEILLQIPDFKTCSKSYNTIFLN